MEAESVRNAQKTVKAERDLAIAESELMWAEKKRAEAEAALYALLAQEKQYEADRLEGKIHG